MSADAAAIIDSLRGQFDRNPRRDFVRVTRGEVEALAALLPHPLRPDDVVMLPERRNGWRFAVVQSVDGPVTHLLTPMSHVPFTEATVTLVRVCTGPTALEGS